MGGVLGAGEGGDFEGEGVRGSRLGELEEGCGWLGNGGDFLRLGGKRLTLSKIVFF